jgi:hypothetical protein
MTLRRFHSKFFASRRLVVVTLVVFFTTQVVADDMKPPNLLVEAAILLNKAREEMGCPAGEADGKKALSTARRFRSASQVDRDTAGALLADIEIFLGETRRRRKFLEGESMEVTKLLASGRVEATRDRIAQANPPKCDDQLNHLRDEADARSTQARVRVALAERTLGSDPKAALKLLRDARTIDPDFPDIDELIARARAAARHYRASGGAARKAFLYTMAIAGVGAGAYFLYQKYGRSTARNTAVAH